jgi:aminomethyltransferase
MLCVNASNIEKDLTWIQAHADGAEVEDQSEATGLLALQGPRAAALLARLGAPDAGALPRFAFAEGKLAGRRALVSRTGYTGSDGFELYLAAADAAPVFEALLEAGRADGLLPCGLGARDTLRLEAALPLYGHELDDEGSPLEAGLDRFVKLAAGGFLGAEAIRARAAAGLRRRLVGFVLEERGIARAEMPLTDERGAELGAVTSGAPSPTLGKSIGLGYVPPAFAPVGTPLRVRIRDRAVQARVVETPFVSRGRA